MLCQLCVYECLNENASVLDTKLKTLIAKYLHIELTEDDELSETIICLNCQQSLEDFDKFFLKIEERRKELEQIYHEDEITNCKPEIIESDSNSGNSFTQSTIEHVEFSYAACNGEIEDTLDENEDVLSLTEELDSKVSITKNIPSAKLKKTAVTRRKSKRKNSKECLKTKVEIPKKRAKTIFSPKEEQERDDLVAKYISFQCELCEEKSENYKQFQSHFQKVHNQKAYITCCGKRLNKRNLILDHVQLHKNPEQFKCELCNKKLKSRVSLNNHNKLYHNRTVLRHGCSICGKKFSYPSMLEKHMTVHNSTKKFLCDLCQKGFKTEFGVQLHMKHMHGERIVHICDICGKEYRFKLSFEQHVAEHQGTFVSQKKQCHLCKIWVAASYFKRHVQRHEKVDVDCEICGQKFNSIPTLTSHKERHHGKLKSYNCPYCDKTFVRPRYLKEHIDVHTGNKEYSCKYCTREFRSKANMYAHTKKVHHELWAQAQLNRYQGPDEEQVVVKNEEDETFVTN